MSNTTITEANTSYATATYADARYRLLCARERMESAKGAHAKRMAAEDVEFYGNRVAYLGAWLKSGKA